MNVNGIEVEKVLNFRATPGFGKWKRYFPKEAVNHPAKINLILLEYLIQHYTEEGDILCDPLSGSGSTGILAALNNRNAICVELEEKFYEMQSGVDCDGYSCHVLGCYQRRELEAELAEIEASWIPFLMTYDPCSLEIDALLDRVHTNTIKLEKLPKKPHHYVGCKELFDKTTLLTPKGSVIFLKGDARRLSEILKERANEIGHIVFSPPYSSAGAKADENPENYMRRMQERYELMKEQGIKRPAMDPGRYSGNPDNIGNLPYFDACIFSPPFGPAQKGGGIAVHGYDGEYGKDESLHLRHDRPLSEDAENISNLPLGEISTNIGNMPPGNIDSIFFSPPYGKKEAWQRYDGEKGFHSYDRNEAKNRCKRDYVKIEHPDNIGNLPTGDIDGIFFLPVDVIVSSPPYAQTTSPFTRGVPLKKGDGPRIGCLNIQDGYSESMRNIGNLPLNLDVCMFSPPYSVGHDSGNHASEEHGWRLEEQRKHTRAYGGGNIAKLPFGTPDEALADCALTSPPYFDSKSDWDETSRARKEGEEVSYVDERHQERKNIGNVHHYDEGEPIAKKYARANGKETYLSAMKTVYGQCFLILKPQGLLILILKNFIRDKQLVPLTEHTIKLCESVGFSLKERLLFKLPHVSFWRNSERKKWKEEGRQYPEDLSYEHILVFEK